MLNSSWQYKGLTEVVFLVALLIALTTNGLLAQNNVLEQGIFYQLTIPMAERGIYKLDKKFFTQLGINTNDINPQNIQLYGNGGGLLPQANSAPRPNGLQENAIWVSGEDDGKFDDNDFVLFYAEGANKIYYDTEYQVIRYQNNFYETNNYYFLTIGAAKGKRVNTITSPQGGGLLLTTFDEVVYYEKDVVNLESGGRNWYGEKITGFAKTQTIATTLSAEGVVSGGTSKLMVQLLGASRIATLKLKLALNNKDIADTDIAPYPVLDTRFTVYTPKGREKMILTTFNNATYWNNTNTTTFSLTLDDGKDNNAFACLDFLVLNTERQLQLYGNQTLFRSIKSLQSPIQTYQLAGSLPNTVQVWDVTTPYQANRYNITNNSFKVESGINSQPKEFIVFNATANFPAPTAAIKIANQALRKLSTPDLLIVAPPVLMSEAKRLAAFRKTNDKLEVEVVTTTSIYNEFSSGKKDVTAIRDFVRWLYQKNKKLKYLLLFGNASYQYKTADDVVPTYQSVESIDPIANYCSDDYFALLDDDEGEWAETGLIQQDKMEIGVGRLPIRYNANTTEMQREAKVLVDKLIGYSLGNSMGKWRMNTVFLADNDDDKLGRFQYESNYLADNISNQYANIQTEKLLIDAYATVSVGSSATSPLVKAKLDKAVERGSLIINYIGHGSESGWTSERVLTANSAASWQGGSNNLPLFMTATCEFGRYDGANRTAAEYALNNPNAGAIGMLTTTRPVYNTNNAFVNEAFWETVFQPLPSGEMPRLGDVIRLTKNNSLRGAANRNFVLLGDPSMRLAYPQQEVLVTNISVNGQISNRLTALSTVVVQGEIRNKGVLNSTFNGTATVAVVDKKYNLQTLGVLDTKMAYSQQDNLIFQGEVSVQNGRFSCTFIVPKNIDYQMGNGKVYVYAVHQDKSVDAAGATTNVLVGGSNTNPALDTASPEVILFVENEQFKNNDIVPSSTQLIAQFADASGISIANSGIGQDIIATLDDSVTFVLNEYYLAAKDDFRKGTIRFPLKNLAAGKHTLRLQVWDTYNNPTTVQVVFFVNQTPLVITTTTTPNPFGERVMIRVTHSRPDVPIATQLAIYNSLGQLVWLFDEQFGFAPASFEYEWKGQNETGGWLENGVYYYNVRLTVTPTGETVQQAGKIVLLR